MSKYSGYCDCYDTLIEIHKYTEEELCNNLRIYVNEEPLYIEKMSDLIPYYAHVVSLSYHNNEERKGVVYLVPNRELSDYYKQNLVDEMIINGLNPADYGYERFLKEV